ncbi:MAG: ParB N-terminal domain-containing protein [Pseudomonadota bacterium]
MSKRRRMFEIEVPEDAPSAVHDVPVGTPDVTGRRRGPMATAVRESAAAVAERAATEAAVREENDRLAHEHVRLKRLGLIATAVSLDAIDTTKLHRDRSSRTADPELEELKASIRELGLSNPIRLEAAEGGRYELIQGWRRLQAYRALHAETGDERFAAIPAGIGRPGESLEKSYRRMVDENMVRRDVSFAEMAMLAQAYAGDPATDCESLHEAVNTLYASAAHQKRAYIRAFADLLEMLETALSFPEAIPRNLGLDLRRRIADGRPTLGEVQEALRARRATTAEEELAVLRLLAGAGSAAAEQDVVDAAGAARRLGPVGEGVRKSRTSFRFATSGGEVRCTAADGRLELRGAADFSAIDRRRLEAAVAAFMREIDG